jgi:hypothetical protein
VTANAPTYEFRQAGFIGSCLVRCRLEDDDLTVEIEGKPPVRVPCRDIVAVHLSRRAHGRNEAVLTARDFRCRVTARRQVVEITNRSDPGVGRPYEYQNRAFNSFVHELHCRLLPFQEHVRFRSGHELYYRLVLVAGAAIAILFPFRLASYGQHLGFGIAVCVAAVAGLLVAGRRLRPRTYAPASIPAELLPPGEDHRGILA